MKAKRLVADGRFRYVIFGHTHHARRISLDGGGTYLNTGTWAELMRVPRAITQRDDALALAAVDDFLAALGTGELAPYTWFRPTYVRMQLSSSGRIGDAELLQAPA